MNLSHDDLILLTMTLEEYERLIRGSWDNLSGTNEYVEKCKELRLRINQEMRDQFSKTPIKLDFDPTRNLQLNEPKGEFVNVTSTTGPPADTRRMDKLETLIQASFWKNRAGGTSFCSDNSKVETMRAAPTLRDAIDLIK